MEPGTGARFSRDERPWFTPESLAERLQVSERMIRKWVAQGRLRSYKIDGCRRFDPVDVDAFLARFVDERGRQR
jgi:excisionase family DNA binding protein